MEGGIRGGESFTQCEKARPATACFAEITHELEPAHPSQENEDFNRHTVEIGARASAAMARAVARLRAAAGRGAHDEFNLLGCRQGGVPERFTLARRALLELIVYPDRGPPFRSHG